MKRALQHLPHCHRRSQQKAACCCFLFGTKGTMASCESDSRNITFSLTGAVKRCGPRQGCPACHFERGHSALPRSSNARPIKPSESSSPGGRSQVWRMTSGALEIVCGPALAGLLCCRIVFLETVCKSCFPFPLERERSAINSSSPGCFT